VERVQRRLLDPVSEPRAACFQPVAVGLAGSARDQVEQSGPRGPVRGRGQVDHPGQVLRPAAALVGGAFGDVVPDVLIDAEPVSA
jgi:hypothetical protein